MMRDVILHIDKWQIFELHFAIIPFLSRSCWSYYKSDFS